MAKLTADTSSTPPCPIDDNAVVPLLLNEDNDVKSTNVFRKQYSFEKRKAYAARTKAKYPDRFLLIAYGKDDLVMATNRFLVPRRVPTNAKNADGSRVRNFDGTYPMTDTTVGHVIFMIRKQCVDLTSSKALFSFFEDPNTGRPTHILKHEELVSNVERKLAHADGFFYAMFTKESVFGEQQ